MLTPLQLPSVYHNPTCNGCARDADSSELRKRLLLYCCESKVETLSRGYKNSFLNLFIHSVSHLHARFSSAKVAGTAALGGLKMPHDQERSQIVLIVPTEMGPSEIGDVVTTPGPWTTSGWLHRGQCFSKPFLGDKMTP